MTVRFASCRKPLLLLLVLMTLAGGLMSLVGRGPSQAFQRATAPSAHYVDTSFQRALTGFAVLSGLKAGLAVLEGSTGGVSAGVSIQLQIGDIVQTAYDYVDVAWRTLLFACLCLFSLQILQEVVIWGIDPVFGLILLLICGVCFLGLAPGRCKILERILKDALGILVYLFLLLTVILPLSLTISAALSEQITQDPLLEAGDGFLRLRNDLFPESEETSLVSRVRAVPEKLDRLGQVLQEKSRDVGKWTIQLIAAYLFDCLFFPLGSALVLGWGFRASWRYAREERRIARILSEIRDLTLPNSP